MPEDLVWLLQPMSFFFTWATFRCSINLRSFCWLSDPSNLCREPVLRLTETVLQFIYTLSCCVESHNWKCAELAFFSTELAWISWQFSWKQQVAFFSYLSHLICKTFQRKVASNLLFTLLLCTLGEYKIHSSLLSYNTEIPETLQDLVLSTCIHYYGI